MIVEDDNITVIGVHERGGVGKTTMVKHVGMQTSKDVLFTYKLWLVVSQSTYLHTKKKKKARSQV